MIACPLCKSSSIEPYHQDKKRSYQKCANCNLVFVLKQYHLSHKAEKAEYDKHENEPLDAGYRQFLSRTTKPLFARIKPSSSGLDFGCGPGPTISLMAAEKGFQVDNYDIYYFNQPELLEKQYEFITMTEVIEHIASPSNLLNLLNNILKEGALLAIMTKRVTGKVAFANWHYKNDPTHICFYSEQTFQWIAQKMNWRLEVIDKDVIFFYKD